MIPLLVAVAGVIAWVRVKRSRRGAGGDVRPAH